MRSLLYVSVYLAFVLIARLIEANEIRHQIWQSGASGEKVVDEVIRQIEECLNLSDEYSLLKRIALAESRYGEDDQVMNSNFKGGIWQITHAIHSKLNNSLAYNASSAMLSQMRQTFEVDCLVCNDDYSVPMRSALASRLYIELTRESIKPKYLVDQAAWWAQNYHFGSNETQFENAVCQFRQSFDLWFLLDATWSISNQDFDVMLAFIGSLASSFEVSHSKVQLGYSTLKYQHDISLRFNESFNLEEFKTSLLNAGKFEDHRQIGKALQEVVDIGFNEDYGARNRSNVKRVIFLITKGKSTDDIAPAISKLSKSDAIVITMGIGNEVDEIKLRSIASKPPLRYARRYFDYSEITLEKTHMNLERKICYPNNTLTERDIDYICAILCIPFCPIAKPDDPYFNRTSDRREIENEFHYDCGNCRTYIFDELRRLAASLHQKVLKERDMFLVDVLALSHKLLLQHSHMGWPASVKDVLEMESESENGTQYCPYCMKADMWFLVDGSWDVNESEFQSSLQFVNSMANRFNISKTYVQVGLSVFSNIHQIYFGFNQTADITSFQRIVNSAKKPTFSKDMGKSLQKVVDDGFNELSGARNVSDSTKHFIVVVTDGVGASDVSSTIPKIKEKGIDVLAIGVGNHENASNMKSISTETDPNYISLNQLSVNNVVDKVNGEIYELYCRVKKKSNVVIESQGSSSNKNTKELSKNEICMKSPTTTTSATNTNASGNESVNGTIPTNRAGREFQTDETNMGLPMGIVGTLVTIIVGVFILLAYVKRKQKKVLPDEETGMQAKAEILEELKQCKDKATLPLASVESMRQLKQALDIAESLNIAQSVLKEYHDCLKDLEKRLSKIMEQLKLATEMAKQSEATEESLQILEDQLNLAVSLYFSPEQLEEPKSAVKDLKIRLEMVKKLDQLQKECKAPNATVVCMEKLQETLDQANNLNISQKKLDQYNNSLHELKSVIDKVKMDLNLITEEAKAPCVNDVTLKQLNEQIELAESFAIPQHELAESFEESNKLAKRIEALQRLYQINEEAKSKDADVQTMLRLQQQLNLAESLHISFDLLKEPKDTLEELKCRLDAEMERFIKMESLLAKLKQKTIEASGEQSSISCLHELDSLLDEAKDLEIAPDLLEDSQYASDQLKEFILTARRDLQTATINATEPDATKANMEFLQDKILLANRLGIEPSVINPSEIVLEKLEKKIEQETKELQELTVDAEQSEATITNLENLKNKLVYAEKLELSSDKINDAKQAVEHLDNKVNTITRNLERFTQEANRASATFLSLKNLENEINIAERIQIPRKQRRNACAVLEQVKDHLNIVVKDLKRATKECLETSATFLEMEELQEKLMFAEILHMDQEDLKESFEALEKLQHRVEEVTKDLSVQTIEAADTSATVMTMETLQQKIVMAEKMCIPPDQLQESYEALEKLKNRVETITRDISNATFSANNPNATLESLETLQEKVVLAEQLGLSSEHLMDAYQGMEKLQTRIDQFRTEMFAMTEEYSGSSLTFSSVEILQEKLIMAKSLGLRPEELAQTYAAMDKINEKIQETTKQLEADTYQAKEQTADYSTLTQLEQQINVSEAMHMPSDQLMKSYEALKSMKAKATEIQNSLEETITEANLVFASLQTMKKLEQQIANAESFNFPQSELQKAYDALNTLKEKQTEVNNIKEELRDAVEYDDVDRITAAIKRADATVYLLRWDPLDDELIDLLEEAKEIEKYFKLYPKETPEQIDLRNQLREELKAAVENDVNRKTLKKITIEFKFSIGRKADYDDSALISTAKQIFLIKTKLELLGYLKDGITSRNVFKLQKALEKVDVALKEDIRQSDIDKDIKIKSALARTKDLIEILGELERMKATIMHLKQPTISEIRSYSQPPVAIQKVMQATFILLGEKPEKVNEWIEVQALVGKMDKDALKRRIWQRDISEISWQQAEKADPLLANLKMADVEEISKAAAVFFAWSKCILHEVKKEHYNQAL